MRTQEPIDLRLNRSLKITQNDCWEWQLAKNNAGYGMIRDGKKMRLAHRVSYEIHNEVELDDNTYIGHKCFNLTCCNPDHLYAVQTRQDIVNNMVQHNRYNRIPRRTGPLPRTICPHCGIEGAVNTHAQYHFDKCKNKKQI